MTTASEVCHTATTYSKNSVVEFAVRFIGKPCVYIDNTLEFDTVEDEIVWKYVADQLIRTWLIN